MAEAASIRYQPEPTPAEFHASDDFCRGILGPVGSGKSVACSLEVFIRACQQRPTALGNGKLVRKSRWAAIRNTYPELKTTTIKTWQDWFGPEICKFKWDIPISATIDYPLGDGTYLNLEVYFIAMDRPQEIKKLKSLELTGAWLNEAVELPKAALDMATSRVGRYPAKREGGPSWRGIILDTNPPDDDHWYYKMAEEEKPEVRLMSGEMLRYSFWRQPPALIKSGEQWVPNPDAENIDNLEGGYDYYYQQLPNKTLEWIKVFVQGQYGTIHDGRPVYPEWSDGGHVAGEQLEPMRGLPLFLGWDFGLTPACVITQLQPHPEGQRFVVFEELLAENYNDDGMGIRQFANEVVKPHLVANYDKMPIRSIGDPAGGQRAQNDSTQTCLRTLRLAGLPTEPGPTQEFQARRDSVATLLLRRNGFLLDPRCKTLRKGFNGGYKLERIEVAGKPGDGRFKDQPTKNRYSHSHDAVQYICTHIEYSAQNRSGRNQRRDVKRVASGGWT